MLAPWIPDRPMPPVELPLTIRRASPQDAAAFARMFADPAIYPGTLQLPYSSAEVWQQRLQDAARAQGELSLVAERGGEVVGSARLFAAGPQVRRRHAAQLGITVAAAAQGQGVGRALMAALIDYADRWAQVLRIELTVFADNERAIRLYRGCGFELEGRHRAYALRDGVYVDTLSMARLHPNPPRWPAAT